MTTQPINQQFIVNGTVQGIGFRPAVYGLATELQLAGCVYNDSRGVVIEVSGGKEIIDQFVSRLHDLPLNKMNIESINRSAVPHFSTNRDPDGAQFQILKTTDKDTASTLMPPDQAICKQCLKDLANPDDTRHYCYHLTACTQCGPRFTVIHKLPYQWKDTSMQPFTMCPDCQEEYEKPVSRRFNFETNSCSQCGPELKLANSQTRQPVNNPTKQTIDLLAQGKIIAIKGIGGFHIACNALDDKVVQMLRERKHRPHKPFAVMFHSLESLKLFAKVSVAAADLLLAPECPIVLLNKKSPPKLGNDNREGMEQLAPSIAPGQHTIGAMLPYSPLHHLIVKQPLVMTSANLSGQPMMYREQDIFEQLADVVDYILYHDREIVVNVDDSIIRIDSVPLPGKEKGNKGVVLRRSRGYVPEPITLPRRLEKKVLCLGAHQKNTFCLGFDNKAILSQHNGDLDTLESQQALERSLDHMMQLFSFEPELIACDLHPGYASTKLAKQLSQQKGIPLIQVQHHQAHVYSCLLENKLPTDQPVLGVTFDGTGYGLDEQIWGGEFFLAHKQQIERIAHFEYVDMQGGDKAVQEPYRMLLSYLWSTFNEAGLDQFNFDNLDQTTVRAIWELLKKGNNIKTSSVGRLFDAASALIAGRNTNSFEGQAAMELETIAWDAEPDDQIYPLETVEHNETMIISMADMFKAMLEDRATKELKAYRFHKTIADSIIQAAERASAKRVLLTGGVFQNVLLTQLAHDKLTKAGFEVYSHSRVPMNDGGISFGQLAYVLHNNLDS